MTSVVSELAPPRLSTYDRWRGRVSADPVLARRWAWAVPVAVTLLAGILRFWNLGHPHELVFDETYYVKEGWTQWQFGFSTTWPEGADERFAAGETDIYTSVANYVIHPPLGKWIVGAGMMLFGPESSFGWRFGVALLGTASVLVLYTIARLLTGSVVFAGVASLLLAVDGMAIAMSRVSLLDGPLTFFTLLSFLFVLLDRRRRLPRLDAAIAAHSGGDPPEWGPVLWNRPWLVAAGAAAGAATAVKWSGLWVLAGLGVYVVVTDALARRRAGVVFWPTDAVRQGLASFVLMVPVAVGVYIASWAGWLATDGGYDRHAADSQPATGFWSWVPLALQSLWRSHVTMYGSAAGITSGHGYASPAWQWPFLVRPTAMFYSGSAEGESGCGAANGCVENIYSMPNPLLWYAGVAAVGYLAYRFAVARHWRHAVVLTGIGVSYVPWLFYPERTIFQFYTVLMLPFLLLALTFALRDIAGPHHADPQRRLAGQRVVIVVLAVALALSAFWYPIVTGMQVPQEFYRLHNWLPGWV